MIEFKESPVEFNESEHTYYLGEKRLAGITGLIHQVLGLGVYPEASDYVKDYTIPRAGSRGTAVHHAIQTYDLLGIKQTEQTVHTRYGCKARNNLNYVDEKWDVSYELACYIEQQKGFWPLANELTVSDNKKFASQIDNVWQNIKTDGIWLVDTKTNNIDLFPICGYFIRNYFDSGEEALKEYLSWQLSIYAELFEYENPAYKVEGLACNWLRKDRSEFWVIERKPSELVWALLESDFEVIDGGIIYYHNNPELFGVRGTLPAKNPENIPIVHQDVVDYVSSLLRQEAELKQKLEEAKQGLKKAMREHNVKSYDFGSFTATLSSGGVATKFDTKRFKAEQPELYNKYTVQSKREGSLTLKTKER